MNAEELVELLGGSPVARLDQAVGKLAGKQQKPRPSPAAYTQCARFLRDAPPAEVERFVTLALDTLPDGGTWFDQALSHLPLDAWERLVPRALDLFESDARGEAHEAVMAYASLQAPESLQPYLARIFDLDVNGESYYAEWPWRVADAAEIARLTQDLAQTVFEGRRQKAWNALLQTRRPEAVALAQAASRLYPGHDFTPCLREVGLLSPGHLLHSNVCFHLVFPAGHFTDTGPPWNPRDLHPTWNLAGAGAPVRFGGSGSGSCGLCGGTLHHVVTLGGSHVYSHDRGEISLQTCLSCLGWEADTLYYKHDAAGLPRSLDQGDCRPQFVAGPLREATCRLELTPNRWLWQDWALSNGRENLHRVMGRPSWIQGAQYPDCKECGAPMHFVAQFDSNLPDAEGSEWLWGSGGIGYVFGCAPCRNTAWLTQCT